MMKHILCQAYTPSEETIKARISARAEAVADRAAESGSTGHRRSDATWNRVYHSVLARLAVDRVLRRISHRPLREYLPDLAPPHRRILRSVDRESA